MNKEKDLLKVINLQKFFANKTGILKAVQNVSFNLKEGEIMGLIGESGSGKTTVGRSLIRLYDDYNGFVSLDGEVISGKKLSRKNKLFLHKNMQMIFQDPHTSMNSQKTIFSILKEPLIINKVLKNKYKDIFSDWKEVKKFFKYTFIEKFQENLLNNLKTENNFESEFIEKWEKNIHKINTEKEDLEEIFAELFLFLESKQNFETKIVNKYYESTKNIFKAYLEAQKNYREENLEYDERKLIDAKDELEKIKMFAKTSKNQVDLEDKIKNLKQELKIFKQEQKEILLRRTNTLKSYMAEFKNNEELYKQQKKISTNEKNYSFNQKWYLIFRKSYFLLFNNLRSLRYLSILEVENLIQKQKLYNLNFFNSIPINKYDKNDLVNEEYISTNYDFSYEKNIKKSNKTKTITLNKENNFKTKIKDLKMKLQNISKESSFSEQDVLNAEKEFLEAEKENKKELDIYLIKHKEKMDKYKTNFEKEKEIYSSIQAKSILLEKNFNEKLEDFYANIQKKIKDQKNKVKIKVLKNELASFKTRIFEKNETLKSFRIEKNLLTKDNEKLKHLLGIKETKLSKKMVKEVFLREVIYSSLEDVGLLRQFAYRYPHEFSGGQRQRIVIARALITEPKVIIADEPIASLDISIQAQVVNLLKELCKTKKIGLIFIAHDLSMVEYIADSILIMHLGQVVERGKTEKIYQNPIHPYTISLFESIPKISNANEKFKASNFEVTYLEKQSASNPPTVHNVSHDHQVLATEEQFNNWN